MLFLAARPDVYSETLHRCQNAIRNVAISLVADKLGEGKGIPGKEEKCQNGGFVEEGSWTRWNRGRRVKSRREHMRENMGFGAWEDRIGCGW